MTVCLASMPRRSRLPLAAAVAILAAALAGCTGMGHAAPVLAAPAGSADLLATPQGVIWSFPSSSAGRAVLRSSDRGQHWIVALPGHGATAGLTASFFLGPGVAWVLQQRPGKHGTERVVLRTSSGGRHWWVSDPLPGQGPRPGQVSHDQLYFADAVHGWLLTVTGPGRPGGRQALSLWRTKDGGRTWTRLPRRGLPLQGWRPGWIGRAGGDCTDDPAITFANPSDGWLTRGACGPASAGPQVWRTTDAGRTWNAVSLRAPAGGWTRWIGYRYRRQAGSDAGRVSVGPAATVASGIHATVLVPIAIGASELVIERSTDGGRRWQIAGAVRTGAVPTQRGNPAWFDPVDGSHWVISAPGRIIETQDTGRHWTFVMSAVSLPGAPASFTNPRHGFVQGTGPVAALATWDAGRKWITQQAPPWLGTDPSASGPAISAVQLVSPRLAVASGPAGLQISADGGRSWTQQLGVARPVSQADFVSDRVGFAITQSELLRSTDGGHTWQPVDQPLAGQIAAVGFWSSQAGVAAAGAGFRYVVTRDGGLHWTPLRLPDGWVAARGPIAGTASGGTAASCFTGNGTGWLIASRGSATPGGSGVSSPGTSKASGATAVLVTTDRGRRWRIGLWPRVLRPGTPAVGLAGCSGGTAWVSVLRHSPRHAALTADLLRTTDLGRSWAGVLHATQPAGAAVATASPNSAFATFAGQGGAVEIGSTGTAGAVWTWHKLAASAFGPQARWLGTSALSSASAWMLFAGPAASGVSYLYGTRDGGRSWHQVITFG